MSRSGEGQEADTRQTIYSDAEAPLLPSQRVDPMVGTEMSSITTGTNQSLHGFPSAVESNVEGKPC